MIPPVWMLPAAIMLDEAQRDDAPLAIMRRNLTLYWRLFDLEPQVAARLRSDARFSAEISDLCHAIERETGVDLFPMLKTALRLRALGLDPSAVLWESETRDGRPGWWMRLP